MSEQENKSEDFDVQPDMDLTSFLAGKAPSTAGLEPLLSGAPPPPNTYWARSDEELHVVEDIWAKLDE